MGNCISTPKIEPHHSHPPETLCQTHFAFINHSVQRVDEKVIKWTHDEYSHEKRFICDQLVFQCSTIQTARGPVLNGLCIGLRNNRHTSYYAHGTSIKSDEYRARIETAGAMVAQTADIPVQLGLIVSEYAEVVATQFDIVWNSELTDILGASSRARHLNWLTAQPPNSWIGQI